MCRVLGTRFLLASANVLGRADEPLIPKPLVTRGSFLAMLMKREMNCIVVRYYQLHNFDGKEKNEVQSNTFRSNIYSSKSHNDQTHFISLVQFLFFQTNLKIRHGFLELFAIVHKQKNLGLLEMKQF